MSGGAAAECSDWRASSASSAGVKACTSRAISYCLTRRRPNSTGSSAPSAIGTPASNSVRSGTDSAIGGDAEGHVRGRAHLAGDAPRPPAARPATDPPPSARRARAGQRAAGQAPPRTLGGPTSSPACGASSSPARSAIRKAGAKSAAGPAPLVVGEAEPDHALPGELRRQPGDHPRVHRMPGPVGGDDDPDPDVGRPRRLLGRVDQQLGERRDPAVHGREPGRIGLQLKPPRPLGPLVLRDLPNQPVQILRSPQDRPGHVIQPLEPEPPALISGGQGRRPLLRQRGRQRNPMPPRKLDHGRVTHSASQMKMKMSLGESHQIMRHAQLSPTPAPACCQLRLLRLF